MSLMPQYYQVHCLNCNGVHMVPVGNPPTDFCSRECRDEWAKRMVGDTDTDAAPVPQPDVTVDARKETR